MGKSTLLNALTGEKVAIVTAKPQTTRNRVMGMVEVPAHKGVHPATQIVFVDTPGVHKPGSHLDRRMLQEVHEALETRDLVLVLVDATRRVMLEESESSGESSAGVSHVSKSRPGAPSSGGEDGGAELSVGVSQVSKSRPGAPGHETQPKDKSARGARGGWASEDEFLFGLVRKLDCPVFLVLTKVDLVKKEDLLPLIEGLMKQHNFAQVIPVSARKKDGLDILVKRIVDVLPQGERFYPQDQYTDQPVRFMVAELIRESILIETGEEVPYASAVVIEEFEEPQEGSRNPLTRIMAAIYCERSGQKAILIGKGGSKLKEIGTTARRKIESLLGTRVYLELHVIVEPGWRESRAFVESLDWRNQLERIATDQVDENKPEEE